MESSRFPHAAEGEERHPDRAPGRDASPVPVARCDTLARCDPEILDRVLGYARHYTDDLNAEPYWLEEDLADLLGVAAIETGGRP